MSRAGAHFGQYRLDRTIGSGGMGQVWLAYDTVMQRDVALKLIHGDLVEDTKYRTRFEREARTVASLSEPHIVPIHGFGTIGDRFYIDMALVDGPDLTAVLRKEGPLEPARAVAIIEQVASALDAAHGAGVIHRDVKPSNILIQPSGFVYLIDFGIAHSDAHTHLTTALGTPAYLAPERLTGESSSASDIYSLTCVLYECLTGSRPFPARDRFGQMQAHRESPPPLPSTVQKSVPAGFDDVIARGMAKRPGDRFATAEELVAASRGALVPARKSRRRIAMWGLAAAAAVGVGAAVTLLAFRDSGPATVAVGADASDVAIDAAHDRAIVTNASGDVITVVDTATQEIAGTLAVGGAPVAVTVDPSSGAVFVVNSRSDSVSVVDLDEWSILGSVEVGQTPTDIAIDADSNTAYVVNLADNSVSVIDLVARSVRSTISVGAGPRCVAVNPETSTAYVTNTAEGPVSVIDTRTDEVTKTIEFDKSVWCLALDPAQNTGYVTNSDDHQVTVISLSENEVTSMIDVGLSPRGVTVDGAAHRAYVANFADGTVSVIDTKTDTVTSTIDVGEIPSHVAANGESVFVTGADGLHIVEP